MYKFVEFICIYNIWTTHVNTLRFVRFLYGVNNNQQATGDQHSDVI